MAGQPGFFDGEERLKALFAAGDPLKRLAQVIDFEVFRGDLEAALSRSDRAKGGWRDPRLWRFLRYQHEVCRREASGWL